MNALAIGLLGLEATGLTERSVAMDLLEAVARDNGLEIAFNHDFAFDDDDTVESAIVSAPKLDAIAISMRPTSAFKLELLRDALARRQDSPVLLFGGPTALAAGPDIASLFPGAITWPGDVETGFTLMLQRLGLSVRPNVPKYRFAMPRHTSTARCVEAGGTVWVEASRGCQLNCSFCILSSAGMDGDWFPRPIDALLDEIEHLRDTFGVTDVSFTDYSAFETKEYIEEFLDKVSSRGIDFTFRCDMRLGTARRFRNYMPALRDAGLRAIFVGVESLVADQRKVYKKGFPGPQVIRDIEKLGIFVAAGFIMLDPMYSPGQFLSQVRGVREFDLIDNIATPFKTIRIQRNTDYERIAFDAGIVIGLNPDLYTFNYRCADAKMEIVRQIVEFFHQTTKEVYYQPYIENNIRQRGDLDAEYLKLLREITLRYKNAQYDLLDTLATIADERPDMAAALPELIRAAEDFDHLRRDIFAQTAADYGTLIDAGVPHYRVDMARFIKNHQSVPAFDSEVIDVSILASPSIFKLVQ